MQETKDNFNKQKDNSVSKCIKSLTVSITTTSNSKRGVWRHWFPVNRPRTLMIKEMKHHAHTFWTCVKKSCEHKNQTRFLKLVWKGSMSEQTWLMYPLTYFNNRCVSRETHKEQNYARVHIHMCLAWGADLSVVCCLLMANACHLTKSKNKLSRTDLS